MHLTRIRHSHACLWRGVLPCPAPGTATRPCAADRCRIERNAFCIGRGGHPPGCRCHRLASGCPYTDEAGSCLQPGTWPGSTPAAHAPCQGAPRRRASPCPHLDTLRHHVVVVWTGSTRLSELPGSCSQRERGSIQESITSWRPGCLTSDRGKSFRLPD